MIEANADRAFPGLVARLTAKAAKLGQAHARSRALIRRDDPRRWRRAGLVWPLFGQG